MKNILFRGKTEYGKWVYGSLILAGKYCCILEAEDEVHPADYPYLDSEIGTIDGQATPVIPETIGQYTGLKDKNGMYIFEGDIVSTRKDGTRTKKLKGYFGVDSDGYPQKIPGYEGETDYHYTCQEDCYALVEFNPRSGYFLRGTSLFVDAICNEVVGNIHDNPELVGKKRKEATDDAD
jgi:uncharacterized phage protein (TIGR01671 family)